MKNYEKKRKTEQESQITGRSRNTKNVEILSGNHTGNRGKRSHTSFGTHKRKMVLRN